MAVGGWGGPSRRLGWRVLGSLVTNGGVPQAGWGWGLGQEGLGSLVLRPARTVATVFVCVFSL